VFTAGARSQRGVKCERLKKTVRAKVGSVDSRIVNVFTSVSSPFWRRWSPSNAMDF